MEPDSSYDLKSMHLPRLTGAKLKLFTHLLENPLTRGLLLRRLFRDGGFTRLRALSLTEPPLFELLAPVLASSQTAEPPAGTGAPEGSGYATIADYQRAYQTGATTPEAVAQRALEAIAASDAGERPLRIFRACDRDDVLQQARASTQRWRQGAPLSPLDGVPVAVKDEFNQAPYATTLGTRGLNIYNGQDAAVVTRLRAAGGVLLGKTNMHEFGAGVTGHNPHHGVARNPHNPEHYAGGSSGGSAAAVAAGLCPVAVGTDGGGSIRIPAAFCGVVGLKPTYGRVSALGVATQGCSVCSSGPLAATVLDAALLYTLIAGPDPRDRATLYQPAVALPDFATSDLRDVTLGIYPPWFEHAAPAQVKCCQAVLHGLQERGARLREINLGGLEMARAAHALTILAEMAAALNPYYAAHRRTLSLEVRSLAVLGRAFTARDYLQAQRARACTSEAFVQAFKTVDAMITPATGCSAPLVQPDALAAGEVNFPLTLDIMRFAFPANLLGLPAIAVPAGYDAQNLPVGLQAIGPPWTEGLLLRLALAAESLVARQKPKVLYNPLLNKNA